MSRTPLDPPFVFDVFEIMGNATQLGQFELVIEVVVNFGVWPVTGEGTLTFIAANGDKLVANGTGSSALIEPGLVLITEHAIIDPDRSTGRFAGATGTFTSQSPRRCSHRRKRRDGRFLRRNDFNEQLTTNNEQLTTNQHKRGR